jgi:hypothetical protein
MERILNFRCPKCNIAWKLSDPNWLKVSCNCGHEISKKEILKKSEQSDSFKQERLSQLQDKNYKSEIVDALRAIPEKQRTDILKTWELAEFPLELNDFKKNLKYFDYDDNIVSVYPAKKIEVKRFSAFLLRKLLPHLNVKHIELFQLLTKQLKNENDIIVVDELLIGIVQNNFTIPSMPELTITLIDNFANQTLLRDLSQSPILDFASHYFEKTKIRELLLMSCISLETKQEVLTKIKNEISKAANNVYKK